MKRFGTAFNAAAQVAIALPVFALAFGSGPASADPTPISKAETLLFMTPHLKDVQSPSRLHYSFRKSGTLEKGFSDTIDVDVSADSNGKRKTAMRSFSSTGASHISSPEFENVETNPVLLFYLNREVGEMKRLTSGSTYYFTKQIRLALAESAQIKDIDIQFDGRTLRAQQITISPYQADPNRDRYSDKRLTAKQYIFTVCDAIPGVLYEIRGVVPAPGGSSEGEAVIDEKLTFASAGAPQ